ncbi:phosphopantetheine-binding protein [Streptomyces odontomachi]|uniref:phosphopantetheine-binding protein n=1 Tax=Streptomyces odontomachi TaxID=2944940 RepID=UPI00210D2327|nr:acyl carrier protein [Streptomyces sp. ODS25]
MNAPSQATAEHHAQQVLSTVQAFRNEQTAAAELTSHIQRDLGLDSLDVAELVVRVQEELGIIASAPPARLDTVGDLVEWLVGPPADGQGEAAAHDEATGRNEAIGRNGAAGRNGAVERGTVS